MSSKRSHILNFTLLMFLILTLPVFASASEFCGDIWSDSSVLSDEVSYPANSSYVTEVSPDRLRQFADPEWLGRQRSENWCWAACAQMALNLHGISVAQERLVQNVFGRVFDTPGNMFDVVKALSGWEFRNPWSRRIFISRAEFVPLNFQNIFNELRDHDSPLIVCLRNPEPVGHAVLVTGIEYDIDHRTGTWHPKSLTYRDPNPQAPSRRRIHWSEFAARATWAVRLTFWDVSN